MHRPETCQLQSGSGEPVPPLPYVNANVELDAISRAGSPVSRRLLTAVPSGRWDQAPESGTLFSEHTVQREVLGGAPPRGSSKETRCQQGCVVVDIGGNPLTRDSFRPAGVKRSKSPSTRYRRSSSLASSGRKQQNTGAIGFLLGDSGEHFVAGWQKKHMHSDSGRHALL